MGGDATPSTVREEDGEGRSDGRGMSVRGIGLETPCFIPLTIILTLDFSHKVAGRKSGWSCLILHHGTAARQTATKEDVLDRIYWIYRIRLGGERRHYTGWVRFAGRVEFACIGVLQSVGMWSCRAK
jgi:hypothetical protein